MNIKASLITRIRAKDYDFFILRIENEDMESYEYIKFDVCDADYKADYIEKAYNDNLYLVHTNKIRISGWEKEKANESGIFGK